MDMTRWKSIYLRIALAFLLLVYVSFSFIDFSIFQGYLIAGLIFCLGIFNCLIIGKTNDKYPSLEVSIGKGKLRVLNYRLCLGGLLFGFIGLVIWWLDFYNPSAYVFLSTGLFFAAFTKITWHRVVKERST